VVRAGQRIGAVGRAGVENGGYKPHLHFAIRTGRQLEPGRLLLTFERNGQTVPLRVAQVSETEIEVAADGALPKTLQVPDRTFEIDSREGKHFLPATVLQGWQSPEFAIVGYGLSTKGWRDPTEFLREKNAGQPPMP
jgi:murein DD-endopeptidase MepM/ murein hydrolase activator NlpD